MASSNADTPRARALGVELRDARKQRGLTTRQVAGLIGRNDSHISRWENGKLIPTPEDTATVLAVLGVNGDERDRLLQLARDALDPDWLSGVDRQLALLSEYERTARRIVHVEPLMIPGMLQTYDYAWATLSAFGQSRAEADQGATLRVGRQRILTAKSPVHVHAFIGTYALEFSVCGDQVLLDQLRHLQELGRRENITIRVLPMGHPTATMLHGSWALMEFSRTKPIVLLEHFGLAATVSDRKPVAAYRTAAEELGDTAMSSAASSELIADVVKSKEKEL